MYCSLLGLIIGSEHFSKISPPAVPKGKRSTLQSIPSSCRKVRLSAPLTCFNNGFKNLGWTSCLGRCCWRSDGTLAWGRDWVVGACPHPRLGSWLCSSHRLRLSSRGSVDVIISAVKQNNIGKLTSLRNFLLVQPILWDESSMCGLVDVRRAGGC